MATANTTTTGKSAQSTRAIESRLRRALKKQGLSLVKTRGIFAQADLGEYHVIKGDNRNDIADYKLTLQDCVDRYLSAPTDCTSHTLELSQAASYALAKKVPDLADRGCTISTAYGDLIIPPGRIAARLAELLHVEISRGGLQ